MIYHLLFKKNHQSSIINHQFSSGFTLVELLIVIAIISILATLLMANFIGIRQKARDSQRKADLRQIQTALEFYRADQKVYPTTSTGWPATCGLSTSTFQYNAVTYMQKIPCDPLGNTSSVYNSGIYYYFYNSVSKTYTLGTCLENGNDQSPDTTTVNPAGSGTCTSGRYYVLNNP